MNRRQNHGNEVVAKKTKGQDNADERKRRHTEESEEAADSWEYRTAKKRKNVNEQDPDGSPTSLSGSEDLEVMSNSSSSWDSWGSDSDSPVEFPEEQLRTKEGANSTGQVLEKIKKKEVAVLSDLEHFWSSKVATIVRKELRTTNDENISSREALERSCDVVEKLSQLPCVISVGFRKESSKFRVIVSDREKALELSDELLHPSIDVVEVTNSHLS